VGTMSDLLSLTDQVWWLSNLVICVARVPMGRWSSVLIVDSW
jgi:hypothetical protein